MCVCVLDVLVCRMSDCELTYQINNWTKQTSGDVVVALSTKDGPLRMVKQW
jgi:L-aminopeptidase/D-esterase-like protein